MDGNGSVNDLVDCMMSAAEEGYKYGFRHIVIMQTPARELIPFQLRVGKLRLLIAEYMQGQKFMVASLRKQYRDARIYHFPTYDITASMMTEPARYGFDAKMATSVCWGCEHPYERIFSDFYHASTRTMHILSRKFLEFLLNGKRDGVLLDGANGVD